MKKPPPPVARRARVWTVLEWAARLSVGLLFIYTGYTKIIDPATFIKEVRTYTLMPLALSNAVALILPWAEVIAGLLLIVGVWRREARILLAAMLLMFIGAKLYGHKGPCGCVPTSSFIFFLFDGPMGYVTNIVLLDLLLVEGYLERLRRRPPQRARLPRPRPKPSGPEPVAT